MEVALFTGHIHRPDRQPVLNEFLIVIKQRNHLLSFVFMLSMVLATFMIAPYIATYMEANCNMARSTLPWLYAVGGVCSLVFMNLSGWMTDRFGARPIFLVCAGTAVVMTLILTNLPPVAAWVAIVVASAFMTFASSRVVPAQAMMLRAADPNTRGAFMSLNTAVSHFATAIGPVIAGSIIGEESHGGALTHYWLVGLIAAGFGVTAWDYRSSLRSDGSDKKWSSRIVVAKTKPKGASRGFRIEPVGSAVYLPSKIDFELFALTTGTSAGLRPTP